jgi:hypothetical protein
MTGRQYKKYDHPQQEQHQRSADAGSDELHIEKTIRSLCHKSFLSEYVNH